MYDTIPVSDECEWTQLMQKNRHCISALTVMWSAMSQHITAQAYITNSGGKQRQPYGCADAVDLKVVARVTQSLRRLSVVAQGRILIWPSMRCWDLTNGIPRGRRPRPLPHPSPTRPPSPRHWRPYPPRRPRPLCPLHPLRLPLLQLQRRWGGKGRRRRPAPHSWGWQRGRHPRYTSWSTWLLSCCLPPSNCPPHSLGTLRHPLHLSPESGDVLTPSLISAAVCRHKSSRSSSSATMLQNQFFCAVRAESCLNCDGITACLNNG